MLSPDTYNLKLEILAFESKFPGRLYPNCIALTRIHDDL